ncbi:MAG: 50S ribosomal protein L28 [Vampirovibrio sp.]|nr:50S ribosomal protein L28 [Vampirovibrio sp.]
MAKHCQLSKKKYNRANKVSFSNKHNKHKQEANLQTKRFWDPQQQKWVRLRVSTKTIKTITKFGLRSAAKRLGAGQAVLAK